ncbi:hypothetical protein [Blastococcus sp. Marseille-P5729]|uniref:hypothetical protein n=1 Tax=Blastococcus sp. Marseille-P5729 TaxID=2086582 RepID=UPI000D114CC9|nr:hypothetical protein [Blastococcus sp. Marseille-P5729]
MGILKKLFSRRPPVPVSAKRYLEPEERELAWAEAVTGQVLVATPRGLHVTGERAHRLVPWHTVTKATWADRKLTVIEAKPAEGSEIVDERPWQLEFDEPGGIPVILRKRVQNSVAVTEHQPIVGGVRFVGRRVAGQDGLLWQYRLDRPRVLSHEERAMAESALEQIRRENTPTDL